MKWSIDRKKCLSCGACVAVCPNSALELSQEIIYDEKKCTFCGICVRACPIGAIEVKK